MASNTKSDKIEHPEYDTIALAAPVDPENIRDIQDSIIPAGYGKISVYKIWAKALGAAISRRIHWTKALCGTLLLDVCSTHVICAFVNNFQWIDLQRM